MNEERTMILQMLKDGDISIEEAQRLLEALPGEKAGETEAVVPAGYGIAPKRITVQVTEQGRTKVNVKVPFSLVRVGLKLGKSFGALGARNSDDPDAAIAMEALKDLDVDEILSALNDGEITLPYVIVDMEEVEKDQQVRVVLE